MLKSQDGSAQRLAPHANGKVERTSPTVLVEICGKVIVLVRRFLVSQDGSAQRLA